MKSNKSTVQQTRVNSISQLDRGKHKAYASDAEELQRAQLVRQSQNEYLQAARKHQNFVMPTDATGSSHSLQHEG